MSEEIEVKIADVKVTEEEKINFFKSFLSNEPYVSKESLFGGKFVVGFSSLNVRQSTDIFEQIRKDQVNQEISSDAAYMMTLTSYRLGQAIQTINDEKYLPDINVMDYKPTGLFDSYIKAKAAPFKEWPSYKMGALAEAFKAFEDKIMYLTKEVTTEDFWVADA